MAINQNDVFTWCPRINANAEIKFATRKAKFGDGYEQIAGDGINNRGQQWDLEFVGDEKTIKAIADFLDKREGRKAFYWKPELNDLGLYRSESYKITALGNKVYSLTTSFVESFGV